ncbi:immunity protein [Pseudomonas fluorescens]|uniref:Immunity protein n=1 Tax=Pseudomonas fluorescens TaxID=294 RepID=A0A5E6W1R1_PSEFL|nr:immunity protein [Pseudomonas fluorescens]VVN22673.1 hypothetical protein PS659_04460 [Pseudomonas fluorescens]
MNIIEEIIKNEPIVDVVSFFALFWPAMRIDSMYGRYRQETILKGELVDAYNSLFREGVLASDENGKTIKGPNWKPPAFVTEKRYKQN